MIRRIRTVRLLHFFNSNRMVTTTTKTPTFHNSSNISALPFSKQTTTWTLRPSSSTLSTNLSPPSPNKISHSNRSSTPANLTTAHQSISLRVPQQTTFSPAVSPTQTLQKITQPTSSDHPTPTMSLLSLKPQATPAAAPTRRRKATATKKAPNSEYNEWSLLHLSINKYNDNKKERTADQETIELAQARRGNCLMQKQVLPKIQICDKRHQST